ncbi:MAG TPA: hypothetical protein PLY45_00845 [bacterium]|nr:hypothetical protein [bacterium]
MKSGEENKIFSWKAALLRWIAAVAAFAGLGASCQGCPFCGQPGCIGGGLGSAILGALAATAATAAVHWHRFKEWVGRRFKK